MNHETPSAVLSLLPAATTDNAKLSLRVSLFGAERSMFLGTPSHSNPGTRQTADPVHVHEKTIMIVSRQCCPGSNQEIPHRLEPMVPLVPPVMTRPGRANQSWSAD